MISVRERFLLALGAGRAAGPSVCLPRSGLCASASHWPHGASVSASPQACLGFRGGSAPSPSRGSAVREQPRAWPGCGDQGALTPRPWLCGGWSRAAPACQPSSCPLSRSGSVCQCVPDPAAPSRPGAQLATGPRVPACSCRVALSHPLSPTCPHPCARAPVPGGSPQPAVAIALQFLSPSPPW